MALNFPDPSVSTTYTDANTGLKYIWNSNVQAWESAIQPPVIVSTAQPSVTLKGFMWFDPSNDTLYVRDQNQWNPVTQGSQGAGTLTVSDNPPGSPNAGDLWWDSSAYSGADPTSGGGGRMYIWYVDDDSAQWMDASPNNAGSISSQAFVSPTEPTTIVDGTLWFDTSTNPNSLKVRNNAINDYELANSVSSGVAEVSSTLPIKVNGDIVAATGNIALTIDEASTTALGVVEYADNAEATAGTALDKVLSPKVLKDNIDSFLPQATETVKGVAELATSDEVITGTSADTIVTPATLNGAIGTFANPTGAIIPFAGNTPPTGYLLCDGTSYTRASYGNLATVITGNNVDANFNVPNLTGDNVPRSPVTGTSIIDPVTTNFNPLNGVQAWIIKT